MVLFGAGTRIAGVAGIAMLLAHGLFKAPLFLAVGIVDHATGTRDVRELSGLGATLRGTAVVSAVAAASMAGLPPLFGFVGKEAAFEAFLAEHSTRGTVIVAGLLVGSTLTAAYSARMLWGAFARKPGVTPTAVGHPPGPTLTVPVGLCAAAGLALGLVPALVDVDAQSYAATLPPGPEEYHLALWHGLGLPLLLSAVALAAGYGLHRARAVVGGLAGHTPRALSAQRGYEVAVGGIDRVAVAVTGRLQAGSVPTYLAMILATVVLLPGTATLLGGSWPDQPVYHAVLQLPLAARGAARRAGAAAGPAPADRGAAGGNGRLRRRRPVRRRRRAGPGAGPVPGRDPVAGRVRVPAAPDAGPLHPRAVAARVSRCPRRVVAAVGGAVVAAMAVVLSGARRVPATVSAEFVRLAPDGAGATNVVSAIIVDFRALDTVGEITVLFVAAVGVVSLVLATPYDRRRRRRVESDGGLPQHEQEVMGR